jgi:SnoaL-like domain
VTDARTAAWAPFSAGQLADLEAIATLKARYFRLLDTRDWAGFEDVFTADCVHHLPSDSPIPTLDNTAYFPMLRASLLPGTSVHHGHMPEITLTGPDTATAIWAMSDVVDAEPEGRPAVHIEGYGHYVETYCKDRHGTWRISSKSNERLWLDRDRADPRKRG